MSDAGFKVLRCASSKICRLFMYEGDPHMKSLLTVITLIFGLVFVQVQTFAALPNAKPENPNLAAGRQAIEAKDFSSAVKA